MGQPWAIVGSLSDHGGTITTGAKTVFACGLPVARLGDTHVDALPFHPNVTPLVIGDPTVFAEGQPVARVGDKAGCGATITAGCLTVFGSEA